MAPPDARLTGYTDSKGNYKGIALDGSKKVIFTGSSNRDWNRGETKHYDDDALSPGTSFNFIPRRSWEQYDRGSGGGRPGIDRRSASGRGRISRPTTYEILWLDSPGYTRYAPRSVDGVPVKLEQILDSSKAFELQRWETDGIPGLVKQEDYHGIIIGNLNGVGVSRARLVPQDQRSKIIVVGGNVRGSPTYRNLDIPTNQLMPRDELESGLRNFLRQHYG